MMRRFDFRGFSTTEMMVSMLLTLSLAAAGWSFYSAETREMLNQSADHAASESARAALDFMSREIRRAGLDPSDLAFQTGGLPLTGNTGVSIAEATRIRVQADRDGSGSINTAAGDPTPESVTYSYDATNRRILRTVGSTAAPLIRDVAVSGLSFEYFDRNGNALTLNGFPLQLTASQRDQIAIVRIRVRTNASGSNGQVLHQLSSRVMLRNRMLEQM